MLGKNWGFLVPSSDTPRLFEYEGTRKKANSCPCSGGAGLRSKLLADSLPLFPFSSPETACQGSLIPVCWPITQVLSISRKRREWCAQEYLSEVPSLDYILIYPGARNPFLGMVFIFRTFPPGNSVELTRVLCLPESFLVPVHSMGPADIPSSRCS